MLSLILPTLLILLRLAHALPTTTTNTKRASTMTKEQWTIPRLDMHMMSTNTGLPGNSWPPSSYFNTTISFDIMHPSHSPSNLNTTLPLTKTTCSASFPNGTLPLTPTSCTAPSSNELFSFHMSPYTALGPRRPELSFVLSLQSAVGYEENRGTAQWMWQGDRAVTANDPSEESSFLTCLEGAPLDGLRCRMGSFLSVRGELEVEVWGESEDGDGRSE